MIGPTVPKHVVKEELQDQEIALLDVIHSIIQNINVSQVKAKLVTSVNA